MVDTVSVSSELERQLMEELTAMFNNQDPYVIEETGQWFYVQRLGEPYDFDKMKMIREQVYGLHDEGIEGLRSQLEGNELHEYVDNEDEQFKDMYILHHFSAETMNVIVYREIPLRAFLY